MAKVTYFVPIGGYNELPKVCDLLQKAGQDFVVGSVPQCSKSRGGPVVPVTVHTDHNSLPVLKALGVNL